MSQIKNETIIFYLDLASKKTILSKKDLSKSISSFLTEKLTKNPKTTFSIFYYKEDNTPFLSDEMQDIKKITDIIHNDWKNRQIAESNFENGLFYCLSFLAGKAVEAEGTFRVICISDLPSKKSAEYAEALMGLVETVRVFPTFIDIIRVGKEDMYPDDVKLRIVATLTSGGLFYVSGPKDFKVTFMGLAKNKILPDLREEGGQEIDEDKKKYYENLAKDLVELEKSDLKICMLCSKEICDFCNDPADVLKKCPKCNKTFHECCGALFSWKFNIGLKHIFRCPECGTILKMDEELVHEINGEPLEEKILTQEELEEEVQEETWSPEEMEEQEKEDKVEKEPEIKKDELATEYERVTGKEAYSNEKETNEFNEWKEEREKLQKEMDQIDEKQAKKMAYRPRGFFGATPTAVKSKKKEEIKDQKKVEEKKKPSGSALARRRAKNRNNGATRNILCHVCGNRIRPKEKFCGKCGSPCN